jgi:hypothetical protein
MSNLRERIQSEIAALAAAQERAKQQTAAEMQAVKQHASAMTDALARISATVAERSAAQVQSIQSISGLVRNQCSAALQAAEAEMAAVREQVVAMIAAAQAKSQGALRRERARWAQSLSLSFSSFRSSALALTARVRACRTHLDGAGRGVVGPAPARGDGAGRRDRRVRRNTEAAGARAAVVPGAVRRRPLPALREPTHIATPTPFRCVGLQAAAEQQERAWSESQTRMGACVAAVSESEVRWAGSLRDCGRPCRPRTSAAQSDMSSRFGSMIAADERSARVMTEHFASGVCAVARVALRSALPQSRARLRAAGVSAVANFASAGQQADATLLAECEQIAAAATQRSAEVHTRKSRARQAPSHAIVLPVRAVPDRRGCALHVSLGDGRRRRPGH